MPTFKSLGFHFPTTQLVHLMFSSRLKYFCRHMNTSCSETAADISKCTITHQKIMNQDKFSSWFLQHNVKPTSWRTIVMANINLTSINGPILFIHSGLVSQQTSVRKIGLLIKLITICHRLSCHSDDIV